MRLSDGSYTLLTCVLVKPYSKSIVSCETKW